MTMYLNSGGKDISGYPLLTSGAFNNNAGPVSIVGTMAPVPLGVLVGMDPIVVGGRAPSPVPVNQVAATPLLNDDRNTAPPAGAGVLLDNHVAQLVQAMATDPTMIVGFDPAVTAQAANDPTPNGSFAEAWHH